VSAYLVRNCYTVCTCFRAGASTFQVLAHHDSARAYFFPPTLVSIPPAPITILSVLVYISSAPVYIPPAPIHIPSTPVPNFQSTSHLRPCLPHRRPRQSNICKRTRKYRPRPWLCICALEHPICASINVFAPEGSHETTAACARGTISPHPIAMHSVQSHCTWACNYGSSCLLGTSLVRTKVDFI
jgi:hypothetical protein